MAHTKYIQAIRIYLPVEVTENFALGIYTAGGASEIRLSEDQLVAPTINWKTGLIALNGIGDRKERIDTRQGGAVSAYDGLSIQLIDTNQYVLALKALGINLSRLPCELYEFTTTSDTGANGSGSVVFTGVIGDINWNETVLEIPVQNARYKRDANITTVNTDGVTTPVTFGNHYPPAPDTVINNLAKFVRTLDTYDDTTYNNSYFDSDGVSYPLIKIFPIETIYTNPVHYSCRMPGVFGSGSVPEPIDIYVIESGGQIRQVTAWECQNGTGYYEVSFYIKDVFLTELIASGDTRTWVQFVKIERNYNGDLWPCKDFLTLAGAATAKPELFSFAEEKYNRIADFGFTVKDADDNNALDIDGSQYDDNIDSLDSFLIKPMLSIQPITTADLSEWDLVASYSKVCDGIYDDGSGITGTSTMTNQADAIDKNSTTYARHTGNLAVEGITNRWYHFFEFTLPVFDLKQTVEKFYIGIKLGINADVNIDELIFSNVLFKRFAYTKTTDKIRASGIHITANSGIIIDDVPDFYYENVVETNNLDFYREHTPNGSSEYEKLTGYTFFEIPGATDIKNYNCYTKGCIYISRGAYNAGAPTPLNVTSIVDIYSACIIAKLPKASIKKEVYSPASGRIFLDTWNGRKTPTALIQNPIDIIEHLKRLQNWSECSPIAFNWGHEYAVTEEPVYYDKIKTSGEGAFDTVALTLTDQTPAFQLHNYEQCQISSLVKRLCKTFDVCSYIDADGNECLETLALTNPAETITFDDLRGDVGNVIEPEISDIYCEPICNYQYDNATEKFNASLRIFNIQNYVKGSNWADCSSGFTSLAEAESVLDIYYALYLKHRQVEPAPSDFADQLFIRTHADAVDYLIRKGNHMAKRRISLPVDYAKGRLYHAAKHVQLNLPHQTNSVDKECLIESVNKSKNNNLVDIELVILEE